jgi:hypothetical protein
VRRRRKLKKNGIVQLGVLLIGKSQGRRCWGQTTGRKGMGQVATEKGGKLAHKYIIIWSEL